MKNRVSTSSLEQSVELTLSELKFIQANNQVNVKQTICL